MDRNCSFFTRRGYPLIGPVAGAAVKHPVRASHVCQKTFNFQDISRPVASLQAGWDLTPMTTSTSVATPIRRGRGRRIEKPRGSGDVGLAGAAAILSAYRLPLSE